MLIGELADEVGVNPKTIRYYESIRLLPEPPRTDAGYRDYGPDDAERLAFVRRATEFDLHRTRSPRYWRCGNATSVPAVTWSRSPVSASMNSTCASPRCSGPAASSNSCSHAPRTSPTATAATAT